MARVVQPNILPEIQGFPTRDFPSRDFPSNEEVLKEWYGTSVPIETNIGETYKKDLLIDPFTQAGMIDLSNVKPIALDPNIVNPIGPHAPDAWNLADAKKNYGYMYPGSEELFVNPTYPRSDVAATITHEVIHGIMDPMKKGKFVADEWTLAPFTTGQGVYSALGPTNIKGAYFPSLENYKDQAAETAQNIRNELITRWFENEVWGNKAPSAKFSYPSNYPGFVNYATMMRPGQGPLGMEGLYKLLSKKLNPLLKKVAYKAHKNIEAKKLEKVPPKKITTAKGSPTIISKPKPKPYVSPARPHGNGGGRRPDKPGGFTDPGKGSYGPHKADGGLINFYRYGGFI